VVDIIPRPVLERIQGHLRERAEVGERGWEAGAEEEDTLTGDFCGSLRTAWTEVATADGTWHWRIEYKKFRGRGTGALEKQLGADGIFQIEAHSASGEIVAKGVLFQAKKTRGRSRSDLREQVRKMEEFAPGSSAVFEFGPDGYKAAPGSIVLREIQREPKRIPRAEEPIGDYLAGRFVPCESGLRGMYYDAVRKILVVPSGGNIRMVPMTLRHRVRINAVHASQMEIWERPREE
jgi:hypothetical protein